MKGSIKGPVPYTDQTVLIHHDPMVVDYNQSYQNGLGMPHITTRLSDKQRRGTESLPVFLIIIIVAML